MESNQQFDLIMIRHAESQANIELDNFVLKNNIKLDWDHLSKNHDFLTEIKYAYKLTDPLITQKGYQQCQKARQQLNGYEPDVILVSPLRRALQTCSKIFKGTKCPVIIQPILAEGLRGSADVGGRIEETQRLFAEYDFSRMEKLGPFWYFLNESKQNQQKYNEIVEANKDKPYEEVLQVIYDYMLKTWIFETPTNLRRRTQKLKGLLKQYRKKYNSIAIVTHYNIVRFTLATEFNQKDEPFHSHYGNCEITKRLIDKL